MTGGVIIGVGTAWFKSEVCFWERKNAPANPPATRTMTIIRKRSKGLLLLGGGPSETATPDGVVGGSIGGSGTGVGGWKLVGCDIGDELGNTVGFGGTEAGGGIGVDDDGIRAETSIFIK